MPVKSHVVAALAQEAIGPLLTKRWRRSAAAGYRCLQAPMAQQKQVHVQVLCSDAVFQLFPLVGGAWPLARQAWCLRKPITN